MNRFDTQHLLLYSILILLGAIHFEVVGLLYGCAPLFAVGMTLSVATSTTLLLSGAGFFHPIRPYPRKSDIVLMLCIVPLVGVFSMLLGAAFFSPVQLISYESLFCVSLSLATLSFLLHYSLSRYVGKESRRMQVVLCLAPLQAVRFIHHLAQLGFARHIDFISFDQYRAFHGKTTTDHKVNLVVWSDEVAQNEKDTSRLLRTHLGGVPVMSANSILETLSGRVSTESFTIWHYLNEARSQTGVVQLFWKCKELIEPVLASILFVILIPLFAVVALMIRLESKGPVIFSQRRVGLFGKDFTLYKFRSMRADAESAGPQWATPGDMRVTRLGGLLRKTRLDELPQLLNVMKGEMSFCGPRPERPEMYEKLSPAIEHFWLRTLVKPGITGWAQIQAGYAASVAESRKKLEFDLYYIQHMSPRLDLIIFLHTAMYIIGCHTPRAEYDLDTRKKSTSIARLDPPIQVLTDSTPSLKGVPTASILQEKAA